MRLSGIIEYRKTSYEYRSKLYKTLYRAVFAMAKYQLRNELVKEYESLRNPALTYSEWVKYKWGYYEYNENTGMSHWCSDPREWNKAIHKRTRELLGRN